MDIKNSSENEKEIENYKNNAVKNWSFIVRKFAMTYNKLDFPMAHHFIKLILKYEEYDEFNKQPNKWFKKEIYKVKEPDINWIKFGSVELDK
jgi:hypothetical protein